MVQTVDCSSSTFPLPASFSTRDHERKVDAYQISLRRSLLCFKEQYYFYYQYFKEQYCIPLSRVRLSGGSNHLIRPQGENREDLISQSHLGWWENVERWFVWCFVPLINRVMTHSLQNQAWSLFSSTSRSMCRNSRFTKSERPAETRKAGHSPATSRWYTAS